MDFLIIFSVASTNNPDKFHSLIARRRWFFLFKLNADSGSLKWFSSTKKHFKLLILCQLLAYNRLCQMDQDNSVAISSPETEIVEVNKQLIMQLNKQLISWSMWRQRRSASTASNASESAPVPQEKLVEQRSAKQRNFVLTNEAKGRDIEEAEERT